jgi:biotin-dependent carboxylase-like uncharacterized protein
MTLRVLEPGLHTLLVDLGRPRTRSLGVPLGGAADRESYLLGNALVGNPPNTVALEINLVGPTLRAEALLGCVVYGAEAPLESDRQTLRVGKTFTLSDGEVLRIGPCERGMRNYLCVQGGLSVPVVLGSRSSLEALREGDVLPCAFSSRVPARFFHLTGPATEEVATLRVLPGAQAEWFADQGWTERSYRVGAASNRMGLRLEGETLRPPTREMTSEPVCPGVVQVTREGQCIVLGVDGQTIGGYPKLAQVIRADLDTLGQLRPGQMLRWQPVTLHEAEQAYRERQLRLREWLLRLAISAGENP